jgi:hypothetical protein
LTHFIHSSHATPQQPTNISNHTTPHHQAFLAPEVMRGRNAVACEQCLHAGGGDDGEAAAPDPSNPPTVALQIELLRCPRYLRLHLIRHGKDDVKIQDPVEVSSGLCAG